MEISRKQLKKDAKAVLKNGYIMALIFSAILCFAGATSYSSPFTSKVESTDYDITAPLSEYGLSPANVTVNDFLEMTGYANPLVSNMLGNISIFALGLAILSLVLTIMILSALIRLFVGYQLEVGARGYFIETAELKESGFGSLKRGFANGAYINVLITMFMRSLLIFLWTLLFVIPGIIKSYSYTFVPYILAENPQLEWKRALEISKEMTHGYKMSIFVLQLSFLGWYLLGTILLGIGQFLVFPYVDATFAQLYLKLCGNAINEGIILDGELGLREENIITFEE